MTSRNKKLKHKLQQLVEKKRRQRLETEPCASCGAPIGHINIYDQTRDEPCAEHLRLREQYWPGEVHAIGFIPVAGTTFKGGQVVPLDPNATYRHDVG